MHVINNFVWVLSVEDRTVTNSCLLHVIWCGVFGGELYHLVNHTASNFCFDNHHVMIYLLQLMITVNKAILVSFNNRVPHQISERDW